MEDIIAVTLLPSKKTVKNTGSLEVSGCGFWGQLFLDKLDIPSLLHVTYNAGELLPALSYGRASPASVALSLHWAEAVQTLGSSGPELRVHQL